MQEDGTVVVGCNEEPDFIHPYLSQTVTGTDVAVGLDDFQDALEGALTRG